MDVMDPALEEIDGAFYRINVTDFDSAKYAENAPYMEYGDDNYEVDCTRDPYQEEEEEEVDVTVLENGKYRVAFHVPRCYYGVIMGQRGGTKQRIENETRTRITIPDKHSNFRDTFIVVTSMVRERVLTARRRILTIVATARSKQPVTHFVSVPMNFPTIMERMKDFKEKVLQLCGNCHGINENIFQTPEKLHLTICVLVVSDGKERELAVDTLRECAQFIIDPILRKNSIKVHIKGVEIMNDDPSDASVLYAKVSEQNSNLFQQLANDISDFFSRTGLVVRRLNEKVKLHVTLMNTSFAKKDNPNFEHPSTENRRSSFDCTKILDIFDTYEFGFVEITSVHLSQLHTAGEDGYYVPSFKINY